MLTADSITVKGRHEQLVAPTSLQLQRGELQLLVSEPQLSRTSLALVLSGRMKPSSGTVSWNSESTLDNLRRHSALVDSPQISEPEAHLLVRDLVAEDLALVPGPFWRKPSAKKWMARHGFSDIAKCWTDAIDPHRLFELQLMLAAENPEHELLVVDSPDRHDLQDQSWLETLESFASSHREFAVLAIVSTLPQGWEQPDEHTQLLEPAADHLPDPSTGFIQEELDLDFAPAFAGEPEAASSDDFFPVEYPADAVQHPAKD